MVRITRKISGMCYKGTYGVNSWNSYILKRGISRIFSLYVFIMLQSIVIFTHNEFNCKINKKEKW